MPQKKIYPPGYGGFVPGIAAGNMHGMTFGSILSKDNLRIANKRANTLSAERFPLHNFISGYVERLVTLAFSPCCHAKPELVIIIATQHLVCRASLELYFCMTML